MPADSPPDSPPVAPPDAPPDAPTGALRFVFVEDSPADFRLLQRQLRAGGVDFAGPRVETEAEFRAGLAGRPDVILCDYNLPQFDAMRALEVLREVGDDIPFLVVSGTIGEETAVEAMRRGACDYLLKDRLGRLGAAVRQALQRRALREAERAAREALRRNEGRYRLLFEANPQPMWTYDAETLRFLAVNEAAVRRYGYSRGEFLAMTIRDIRPPEDVADLDARTAALSERPPAGPFDEPRTWRHRLKGGGEIVVQISSHDLSIDGRAARLVVAVDVTQREREAAELRWKTAVLEAQVHSSPDGVVVVDARGRKVLQNRRMAEMWGVPAEAAAAQDDAEQLRFVAGRTPDPAAFEARVRELDARQDEVAHDEVPLSDGRAFERSSSPVRGADGAYHGRIWTFRDVTARKRSEALLLLRDRAIRAASQGITVADAAAPGRPLVYVSPAFERISGYPAAEALGRNCRFLQGKETDPAAVARLRAAIDAGEACRVELLNYRKDGTPFWNELSVSPVHDDAGRLTHYVGVQSDATLRRALEDRLRQAQKMEAVGRLAGGVAHDFNNLLTVINSYAELLLGELPAAGPAPRAAAAIRDAGERAASLTEQLLVFSRKSIVAPKVFDLNEAVERVAGLLRRLIGEDVALALALSPGLSPLKADPGQVDQVVMNLAVNARDAMPQGGSLTVRTRDVVVGAPGEGAEAHAELAPGRYVCLEVADTGCGMTDEVKASAFEPFFTTKGPGAGTGLGLATVYGIAKTYGGHVEVESEVGVGTTFTVLLPAAPAAEAGPAPSGAARGIAVAPRGTETVLLVEDEAVVRRLARTVLKMQGYSVIEAGGAAEARRVAAEHAGPLHLLLTDVVMPGGGGRELAEALRARHPGLRVLYMSGYTDDAVVRHGVREAAEHFLQKPFTPVTLASKVREVLGAAAGG